MWSSEEELEDLYDGRSELLQPINQSASAYYANPEVALIEWRGSDRLGLEREVSGISMGWL